jgi:MFS family permease
LAIWNALARAAANRLFSAFQHRDYRILWAANLSAGSAHWALIVARGWLVYDLTDSSSLVGLVTFAAMIPRLLITPFAGYLVDRFDRRTVLAWTFVINLLHNSLLAFLTLTNLIAVWHLVILSLVNGSARATQMPAGAALVPNVVAHENLLNAIALNSVTQHGSRLVGPAAIAPFLTLFGVGSAFLLCSAFYGAGLILVSCLRVRSRGVMDHSRSMLANLLAGVTHIYSHPLLLPLMLLIVAHCALTMSFESVLPALSESKLNAAGSGFSFLMMSVGAGALAVSLSLAAVRSGKTRGRLILLLGIISGISPIGLALAPNMPLAIIATTIMGGSQAGFMTLFAVTVQSTIPDSIRGRITSVNNLHIGGMMALFNLVNGSLADHISPSLALSVAAVAFLFLILASFLNHQLRIVYTDGFTS